MVAKKLHHTPKPQIQSVKPRRRRLGIRTIPCVFGEERRIKRFWYVFWKRGERCRKRLSRAQEPGRPLFFWFEGCLGPFIALAHFSRRTVATFKRPWIGLILTPLKIFWLFVSEKVWILKIQRSNQKLWLSKVSDASIGVLPWFLWYLGLSNSDFNP